MQSLYGFCKAHNLPKTSVKRWLNAQGYPTDQGIDDTIGQLVLETFVPSKPEEVEPEIVNENPPAAIVRRETQAPVSSPFHIENLNITINQVDTSGIEGEVEHLQAVNAQAYSALGQLFQGNLENLVSTAVAQQSHMIAGLSAQAAVNVVNKVGKPPAQSDPDTGERPQ